jgi:hypothetical protein
MNVRSEPEVRPALDPRKSARSLMSKVKCEIPKTRNRRITRSNGYRDFRYREMEKSETLNIRSPEVPKRETPKFQKQAHHTGISDTGRWRSQRLSTSGVPKCRKVKRRNSRSRHIIPGFRLPGDGEVRDSQHQESRSAEKRNAEISEAGTSYQDFGYREMEKSYTLITRSPEVPKMKS